MFLLLFLCSCASKQVKDWEGVTLTGKVVDASGSTVAGAHVYAYAVEKSDNLGPADAMSEPTVADGKYLLVLPEGTYTLIARKRVSGSISGPLRSGDMAGQLPRPYLAGRDDRKNVDIVMKAFRHGMDGDPRMVLVTATRIRGTVVDKSGAAIHGINVFAYMGSFRPDPPDYTAPVTDSEGRFEISLPGAGTYTIGARTGLGGRPGPGDRIGFWGGKDQAREIREGKVIEEVRIVVEPFKEEGIGNEE